MIDERRVQKRTKLCNYNMIHNVTKVLYVFILYIQYENKESFIKCNEEMDFEWRPSGARNN